MNRLGRTLVLRTRHLSPIIKQVEQKVAALLLKVVDVGYRLLSACGSHKANSHRVASLKPSSGNRTRSKKDAVFEETPFSLSIFQLAPLPVKRGVSMNKETRQCANCGEVKEVNPNGLCDECLKEIVRGEKLG